MQRLVLVLGIVVVAAFLVAWAAADEPQGGTLTGILTAKGENWIEVKADGATASVRYWPFRRGGNDGGFDKDMLRIFASLTVGHKITVQWTYDERLRAIKVQPAQQ